MKNFFSNNLSSNNYFEILNKYKKLNSKFVLENYGSLIGDKSLFRFLTLYELLKKAKKVKGNIIEFGTWNGNSLIFQKKIIEFLKIKKKIFGYDHFKGMPFSTGSNNFFVGDKKYIKFILNFFKLNQVFLIDDDFKNVKKYKKQISKISFAYIDCDLYEETKILLNFINNNISKGGIILFDEAFRNSRKGEAKALKEFYNQHKKLYTLHKLKKHYQPDIYLIKK